MQSIRIREAGIRVNNGRISVVVRGEKVLDAPVPDTEPEYGGDFHDWRQFKLERAQAAGEKELHDFEGDGFRIDFEQSLLFLPRGAVPHIRIKDGTIHIRDGRLTIYVRGEQVLDAPAPESEPEFSGDYLDWRNYKYDNAKAAGEELEDFEWDKYRICFEESLLFIDE